MRYAKRARRLITDFRAAGGCVVYSSVCVCSMRLGARHSHHRPYQTHYPTRAYIYGFAVCQRRVCE